MSFDKIKVMRNAERFLSQGKIRAAITEYKRIVDVNPKDFSTLNILGDLYVKNSENSEAVACFRQVAEHYYGQGFANKAIAVYNKIARIQPDSMEIAARLAQLYKMRGSYAEARDQYVRLAEHYQSKGQKIEALAIWKQIAELDPNNTEVYLSIAEACKVENQIGDAVEAYTEAGLRFNSQEKFESAVGAFGKALQLNPSDLKAINGFVVAKIGLGCADEAADVLEKALEKDSYNRDLLFLLIECYLDIDNAAKAEKAVLTLVQQEPANYPKFLDVVHSYMKNNDLESSVRVLLISFEHILGAGKSEEFLSWINEILARNPEYIEGLRLLVRYYTWHRNDAEIRKALERLAETARLTESVADERYALGQLVIMSPLQPEFAERLQELKTLYGVEETEAAKEKKKTDVPEFENFTELNDDNVVGEEFVESFEHYSGDFNFSDSNDNTLLADAFNTENNNETVTDFDFYSEDLGSSFSKNEIPVNEIREVEKIVTEPISNEKEENVVEKVSNEEKIQKEIESIEFYIEQGYKDLAIKCLNSLVDEFGQQARFDEIRRNVFIPVQDFVESKQAKVAEEKVQKDELISPAIDVFEDFRSDLGLEEPEETDDSDYSTFYQTAIAYKEMGLMEDAIKEFQKAINLVEINDEMRRYFQCANLLGHCFMMKGMPNLAITWFKRALETPELNDEEIQALHYELAVAYESGGEKDKAFLHFEQVYALDVDYRDIGQRIQNLRENYSSTMIN